MAHTFGAVLLPQADGIQLLLICSCITEPGMLEEEEKED